MTPGDRIMEILLANKRLRRSPRTHEDLAILIGMKPDTLRKKIRWRGVQEANVRAWRPGEVEKIAQVLGVPAGYLLLGEKPRPFKAIQPVITVLGQYAQVPPELTREDYLAVPMIEAQIAAGYLAEIPEDYVTSLVWVYKPEIGRRQHHNLRAVQLAKNADSMVPTIRPGDIIIVDPTERPPMKPLNKNAIYAVRSQEEGGCAVKRVKEVADYWLLLSDNKEKEPILLRKEREDNPFIGRVIWSWTSWVR
ncbi:MAG: LexA family transcriptional regulator [Deltaproteobacteria bacterium]|nr:LexA family transcriptional regulator [Deltaproteobacteria bacterium]